MADKPIYKKTKTEILEDYNNLLSQVEEIKMSAKIAYEPGNAEIISKANEQTVNSINQSISELKNAISEGYDQFSIKFYESLSALSNNILNEIKKFEDLQKAVEISKKKLETQYNIEIAAETIEQLIAECEAKKKQLANDLEKREEEISQEIHTQKINWERDREEYVYSQKLKQKRENDLYEEEKLKREQLLAEREENIKKQEDEIKALKKQIEEYPQMLEKRLLEKEKETGSRLNEEFKNKTAAMQKDWESEKQIYEMKIDGSNEKIKNMEIEISMLKKEAESAYKKAQELAVKIIESGTKAKITKDEPNNGQNN